MGPAPPPPPVDVRLGEAFQHSVGPQSAAVSALGEYTADSGMARASQLTAPLRESAESRNDPTDQILPWREWVELNYSDLAKKGKVPFFVAQQLQEGYDRYLKRQQLLFNMRMDASQRDTARMTAETARDKLNLPQLMSNAFELLQSPDPEQRTLAKKFLLSQIEEREREPQATQAGLLEKSGLATQKFQSDIDLSDARAESLREPKESRARNVFDLSKDAGKDAELLQSFIDKNKGEGQRRPNLSQSASGEIETSSGDIKRAMVEKDTEAMITGWSSVMRHLASQDQRQHPEIYAGYDRTGTRPTIAKVTKLWESVPAPSFWRNDKPELLNEVEFILRTLLATDPQYADDEQKREVHTAAVENWLRKMRAALE